MNSSSSSPRNNDSASERRLATEGAAALERLVRDHIKTERTTVQRTFHLTHENHDGVLLEDWWDVFSAAAASLQLRPAVLDCSVDQIIRLMGDGADCVLLERDKSEAGSYPQWLLLNQDTKSRNSLWESGTGEVTTIKSERALRQRLSLLSEDERIRCVAFDWREVTLAAVQGSSDDPMKPLTRLIAILRPEWSDIYLVIVFAFVVGLFTLASPIAVEALVDTVAFGRFLQPILVLALILFFFLGFSAAILALQTYIVEIIQVRLFARVAGDLAHRLPRLSTEDNEGEYLPELTNRFFDVPTVQKASASLLLDGIGLVMSVLIGMAVLGFYHPFLLGFDLLLLAAIVFIIVVLGRGAVKTSVKESKSKYYMAAWLEDISRCQTIFQSAAGKRLSACRSDRLIYDYLINRKKHFRVLMRQILFALGLQAFASTVLLGLGGYLVVTGGLTLGQLVAAELIVAIIVGAFAKMGKHFESFYDLLASVDKLGVLFDLPMAHGGTVLHQRTGKPMVIEFHGAMYKRAKQHHSFAPLTMSLPGGSSLAILGGSGTGKSTVLDLIYGTRRPTSGQVLVDGTQPADFQTDEYWNTVSLVRDGEVFASTIEESIHVQRTDVSGHDVEDAVQAVGLAGVINSTPEGLQTHINSGGAPLAPNQIRLLLLARGIAGWPSLMLIDGVLDSLSDDEAETVLDYLLDPQHPWTLVIATGRRWIAERCQHTMELPSMTPARTTTAGNAG